MSRNNIRVLVTAAAGKQGGAVANLLLDHGHSVTAYVRSTDSEPSRALGKRGARLVAGDLSDGEALKKAATDVDAIFGITVPFSSRGMQDEAPQGRALLSAAESRKIPLVYSSVAGAHPGLPDGGMSFIASKQRIEADIAKSGVPYTIIGPVYFMENIFNFDFNGLKHNIYSLPVSPDTKIDEVTVRDIGGMAVYAIENPEKLRGKTIDIASERVSGRQVAEILSRIAGRRIDYVKMSIEEARVKAGEQMARMYERFESNPRRINIEGLRKEYPEVKWHSFEDWARSVDWGRMLPHIQAA
jgi:uncharacterized protein YbjT (DUF2867 family)